MEPTTFNIGAYILIPILAAVLGGWVGAFFGNKYQKAQEDKKMMEVRNIAIKALDIIKSYSKRSYREVEGEFNKSLSIAEKRTIVVALHKLGIPFGVPTDETFNIKKIHFIDAVIDLGEIDGIILQIEKGYCDNLFYLDPDSYFAANYTLFAKRNVAKRYVSEVLAKSRVDLTTNQLIEPIELGKIFSLGEFKSIQVLREQVRDQMYFDKNGQPIKNKIMSLLKDIDLGLWDIYLMWGYEAYQNISIQNRMGLFLSNLSANSFYQKNDEEQKSTSHGDKGKNKKLEKAKKKMF